MAAERMQIERYVTIVMAILVSGASGLLAQSKPPSIEDLSLECCRVAFTVDNVLKAVRTLPPLTGSLRLTRIEPDGGPRAGYPGYVGAPWSHYRDIFVSEYKNWPPVAYLFDTATSRSISLWNPTTGVYMFRRIRGMDLSHLKDGSTIVHLAPASGYIRNILYVWIVTKAPVDQEKSAVLTLEAQKNLGVPSIHAYVATTPFFWKHSRYPLQLPAFGELSKRDLESAKPTLEYHCEILPASNSPVCSASRIQFQ